MKINNQILNTNPVCLLFIKSGHELIAMCSHETPVRFTKKILKIQYRINRQYSVLRHLIYHRYLIHICRMSVNPGSKSTVTQIVDRLNFNGFSCSSSKVFPVTSCFHLVATFYHLRIIWYDPSC